MTDEKLCACGQPLHYTDPKVEEQVSTVVEMMGENIKVVTPGGIYEIPRHYIALHGIKASEVPDLAEQLGFPKVG